MPSPLLTTKQLAIHEGMQRLIMSLNKSTNVRSFMSDIFLFNETAASNPEVWTAPFTDEEIENLFRETFRHRPDLLSSVNSLSSTCKSRIRIWRSEYNRGLWTDSGYPQKVFSFRYGSNGVPINRHGNPLPESVIWEYICSCPNDPRKEAQPC